MIEAAIFDWDGVVSDSDKLSAEAEQITAVSYAAELGVELDLSTIEWSKFQGMARVKIAAALFEVSPDSELAERYRESVVDTTVEIIGPHNLSVVDGVRPFLDYMQRRTGSLSVATSSNRRILDPSIELFGIRGYFRETVAHRECLDDKPKPGQYLEVMRRLNIENRRTLVIEDSASGITAARHAGAIVLAIATTKSVEYLRKSTSAHLVAKDYEHAAHLLQPYL